MVMTILNEQSRPAARPTDRLDALRAAWHDFRQRRADRRALARAGRLGPRLLADMGFDARRDPRRRRRLGRPAPERPPGAPAAMRDRMPGAGAARVRLPRRDAQWSFGSSSSSDFLASP